MPRDLLSKGMTKGLICEAHLQVSNVETSCTLLSSNGSEKSVNYWTDPIEESLKVHVSRAEFALFL